MCFSWGQQYYPQVFLDKCLFKLWMLQYDRIDMSEGIDVKKPMAFMSVLFVLFVCY